MWFSYSLWCDRSVFSVCQLCGSVTAWDVIGVCSGCVSYVVQLQLVMWSECVQLVSAMWFSYSLWCDRSVFSLCRLFGSVTAFDVIGECSACVSYVVQLQLVMWSESVQLVSAMWDRYFFGSDGSLFLFSYSSFPVTTFGIDLFWGAYINKLPFLLEHSDLE
jgi:hypothetical protein